MDNQAVAPSAWPVENKDVSIQKAANGLVIRLRGGKRLAEAKRYEEPHVATNIEAAVEIVGKFFNED